MKPKFLFTLGGDLGQHTISEPEGWAKIIFNLERDLTYWSLIENFEVPLIFYGTAEGKDGGYTYLNSAKANGIDTKVLLDIQVSFDDGDSYEVCFDGRIDLSTAKETIYRSKIEAAIVRNDLWAMFMANKSKPIDLLSTTDLYGNSRYPIPYQELNLPSQIINQRFSGYQANLLLFFYGADWIINNYIQINLDTVLLDEIKDSFELPDSFNPAIPASKFTAVFGGDYTFDLKVEASGRVDSPLNITYGNTYVKWYIQINTDAAIAFTETNFGSGTYKSTVYTYSGTQTLSVGDEIHIYAQIIADISVLGASAQYQIWSFATNVTPSGAGNVAGSYPTYFKVIAGTTFMNTTTDSVLLHDAGLSICDRILGRDDSFYSAFLGGANTAIHYNDNGCGYLNTLTRGKNLRGFTFAEKPFTLSFDDWWAGVNPMFNLGLGYEELTNNSPGSTVIRVEKKSDFFNVNPSVYLTAINDIQIEFDLNLYTKTIEIGLEQWAAESASGIDDPQTKHIYNLRFQLFGKDEKQLSKFIAASLAIEQGRRLTKIQNTDWRLDENIFIIALQEQDSPGSSPSTITQQPELFNSGVTGIDNSQTRYNIRHTPSRFLSRWKDFYSGQMQDYLTDFFKYGSGEGNVLMSWTGDSCDLGTLIENQNQAVSATYLFLPIVYSFTHPLTWDEYATIRDNRKNAISISWILSGVVYTKIAFIKKLGYNINKSKGTFEVWIRS